MSSNHRSVAWISAAIYILLLVGPATARDDRQTGRPASISLVAPSQHASPPSSPQVPTEPEAPAPGAMTDFIWERWSGPDVACDMGPCTWDRTFGGPSDDKVSAAVQVAGGGFVIVGNTRQSPTGTYDAWILRVGDDGALLWRQLYGGTETDQLRDVVAMPDGGVVAVGHTRSRGAGESDVWLLRLSADGIPLFERVLGGAANDRVHAAAATDDGGLVLAGFTASEGAGERDLWVMRVAEDGTEAWSRTLGSAHHDEGLDLIVFEDGGVAVTGHVWMDDERGYDVAVARLSADGNMVWWRSLDRATFEAGTALAPSPDGGVLVVGTTSVTGLRDTDLWGIRLDAAGNTLWERTYGGSRAEEPWDVTALASGGFVVAVETFSQGAGGGDIWLLHLTPDGDVAWERLFGGVLWDHPSALIETADGSLLLGGHTASKGAGFEDGWLLRLTADGRL